MHNKHDQTLILMGGEEGNFCFVDDIYSIDLKNKTLDKVETDSKPPAGRYGHTASFIYPFLFVFGGYTAFGLSNELWSFNIQTCTWR